MKITTPLNEQIIIQLNADESNTVLLALTHTRREYLGSEERRLIAAVAHEIESRLVRVVQIARA